MMNEGRKEEQERASRMRMARAWEQLKVDPRNWDEEVPAGAVEADEKALSHINTYGNLPKFYLDRLFTCRDCGSEELWTAEQQKWWYEEAKGHIDSIAVRCQPCRRKAKGVGV